MLEGVEIEDGGDDFIGNSGSASDEDAHAIHGCVDEYGIAICVSRVPLNLDQPNLMFCWKTSSSLSSSPDASASSWGNERKGWFLGTRAIDVSFCSGLCVYRQSMWRLEHTSVKILRTLGSEITPGVWT